MSGNELREYRTFEEFRLLVDGFHVFCGLLLFAFAKNECSTKDIIIRNFIARTDTMVRAVMRLWEISEAFRGAIEGGEDGS